jgi:hypothetical protein
MAVNPTTGVNYAELSSDELKVLLRDMNHSIENAKQSPIAKHLPVEGWRHSKQMIEEELEGRATDATHTD